MDVPPTWLKKVQEKCKNEPDRLHIVFFDEITNALPSIQGIAFNIVLDREVMVFGNYQKMLELLLQEMI